MGVPPGRPRAGVNNEGHRQHVGGLGSSLHDALDDRQGGSHLRVGHLKHELVVHLRVCAASLCRRDGRQADGRWSGEKGLLSAEGG